jgi:hypothetical protein
MASDPPPQGDLTAYQVATADLPPAIRESLYRTFTRARLTENDPLWAVVAANAAVQKAFLAEWKEHAGNLQGPNGAPPTTTAHGVAELQKLTARIEAAADRVDAKAEVLTSVSKRLVILGLMLATIGGGLAVVIFCLATGLFK